MLTRPLGPCLARVSPPCPRLADAGHGRCSVHQRQERTAYDRRRGTAAQRGYGAEWRKVRAAHLALQPFCEVSGCGQIASDVHHRERYPSLGPDHRDYTLISYCHRHHSEVTSRQVR